MERKIEFVVTVKKWVDRTYGNTYHSVKIEDMEGNIRVSNSCCYGYDDAYKETTLKVLHKNFLLTDVLSIRDYERVNNYPIYWNVSEGLKREMINNVK